MKKRLALILFLILTISRITEKTPIQGQDLLLSTTLVESPIEHRRLAVKQVRLFSIPIAPTETLAFTLRCPLKEDILALDSNKPGGTLRMRIPSGTLVELLQEELEAGWLHIRIQGVEGFVSMSDVSVRDVLP